MKKVRAARAARPVRQRAAQPESKAGARPTAASRTAAVQQLQPLVGNAGVGRILQRAMTKEQLDVMQGAEAVGETLQTLGIDPMGASSALANLQIEHLGGGKSGENYVSALHARAGMAMQRFHANWSRGIENFQTAMSFASDQETELDVNGIIASTAKGILDGIVDLAPPGLKQVVLAEIGAISGMIAEAGRMDNARKDRRISLAIQGARNLVGEREKEATTAHNNTRAEVLKGYWNAAGGKPQAEEQHGYVTGEAATWVEEYRRAVERFEQAVPDVQKFQQQITESFSKTGEATGSFAMKMSGELYMTVTVSTEDGKVELDAPKKWTLVTTAPKPERVAQSLKDSLGGKPVVGCGLRKVVVVNDGDDYGRSLDMLQFDDPETLPAQYPGGGQIKDMLDSPAWRKQVLEVIDLEGSDGY